MNNTITSTNPINLTPYTQYLKDLSKSRNTIKSYTEHITAFLKFTNNPTPLTRKHLLPYLSHLNQIKNSAQTIRAKLSAISSYNEYLIYIGKQTETIITKMDFPKIQAQCISPAKVSEEEALKFLDTLLKKETYRNYTIASFLFHVGTRITETLNIQVKDLDLAEGTCIMRSATTKGNKQRIVYLNDKIITILKKYLTEERPLYNHASTSPYLFVSDQSPKLVYQTIEIIFDKHSKKVNPHQLRHAMASWAVKPKDQNGGGLSLEQVASQLGHGSTNTTVKYTHPDMTTMRKMLNR